MTYVACVGPYNVGISDLLLRVEKHCNKWMDRLMDGWMDGQIIKLVLYWRLDGMIVGAMDG